MAHPHQLGAVSLQVLAELQAGPQTANQIADASGLDARTVRVALQRMRTRGLVSVVPSLAPKARGDHGVPQRWQSIPSAVALVTRQPLPAPASAAVVRRVSQDYHPTPRRLHGVDYDSHSGRVPLSAYSGASSLVGTARWGSA